MIECGELGFEIASDGQRDRRDPAIRDALADEVERFGALLVDVHQEEVRAPLTKLVEPRLRRSYRPRHVDPMVESEGNEVRKRLLGYDQHARGTTELFWFGYRPSLPSR